MAFYDVNMVIHQVEYKNNKELIDKYISNSNLKNSAIKCSKLLDIFFLRVKKQFVPNHNNFNSWIMHLEEDKKKTEYISFVIYQKTVQVEFRRRRLIPEELKPKLKKKNKSWDYYILREFTLDDVHLISLYLKAIRNTFLK